MEYEKVIHFDRFHANQTEEFKIIRILKQMGSSISREPDQGYRNRYNPIVKARL